MLWSFGKLFFRASPRPLFGFRRAILRLFGAEIGPHVNVYSTTQICMPWNLSVGAWSSIGEFAFIYNLGRVSIGERATISYRAHVCAGTHDFSDPATPLLKPEIRIGDDAWIGTDAFIGPGVRIGHGTIVGARSVVVRDVAAGNVVAGNPCQVIGRRPQPGAETSNT